MTEGIECLNAKTKRDLFLFNGEKPTVINLEHVTMITREGAKISFTFVMNGMAVDMESEDLAKTIFDQLLKVWSGDVLE